MKIVAFSDYRVQDIPKTFEFVSKQKPDLILYAGDDVHRFGPLPKEQLKKLSVGENTLGFPEMDGTTPFVVKTKKPSEENNAS